LKIAIADKQDDIRRSEQSAQETDRQYQQRLRLQGLDYEKRIAATVADAHQREEALIARVAELEVAAKDARLQQEHMRLQTDVDIQQALQQQHTQLRERVHELEREATGLLFAMQM
jgi:hypothetical protein